MLKSRNFTLISIMDNLEIFELMDYISVEIFPISLNFLVTSLMLIIIAPLVFAHNIRPFQRFLLVYITFCTLCSMPAVFSGAFDEKHSDHEESKETLQNGDLHIEVVRIFLTSEAILPHSLNYMISSMICGLGGKLWQTLLNSEGIVLVLTLFNMMTNIYAYFRRRDLVLNHLLPFAIFRAAVITVEYFKLPYIQMILVYLRCNMCFCFFWGVCLLLPNIN